MILWVNLQTTGNQQLGNSFFLPRKSGLYVFADRAITNATSFDSFSIPYRIDFHGYFGAGSFTRCPDELCVISNCRPERRRLRWSHRSSGTRRRPSAACLSVGPTITETTFENIAPTGRCAHFLDGINRGVCDENSIMLELSAGWQHR